MSAFPHGLAGRLSLAVAVLALAAPAPARAEFVTFQFEGVITRSTSLLVSEGDRFSGTFTYDLGAIDEDPDNPTVGFYSFELPQARPVGMSYTAGSFAHSTQLIVEMLILNDSLFGDTLLFGSDTLTGPGVNPPSGFITLEDPTGTAFSSDRPPATLDLTRFSSFRLFEGRDGSPQGFFEGEIQALTVVAQPVPEPGTLTLMGVGAVLLLGGRCLRRRTAPA